MAAAQQLSQLGLVPTTGEQYDAKPAGALVGTSPAAGTSVPPGKKVELIVSAGWPKLAFDNGTAIQLAAAPGQAITNLPSSGQSEDEASWSPDGTDLVYVAGPASSGQLMLVAAGQQGAQPMALTGSGSDDHDPAFAPTTSQKLLAFVDDSGGNSQLCFAVVGPNQLNPDCTSHPGWTFGNEVDWSPDGTKILVFGAKNGSNGSVFGLIEFESNVPFSTQASLWGQGTVVTDTSTSGQGVIDGAFSPNGKKLALVSNTGTLAFHAIITSPTNFMLTSGKASVLPEGACQVAWRPDGKELAVMQADSACKSTLGNIVGIDPSDPTTFTSIATQAENPAWQPLALGG